MNTVDTDVMRQLLTDVLATHTAQIDGKFELIKQELGQIKEQTTKTNGRVTRLEEKTEVLKINDIEHVTHCPHASRIQSLENSELSKKSIYKFIGVAAAAIAAIASIVIAFFSLVLKS